MSGIRMIAHARGEWAPTLQEDAAIRIDGLIVNYGRERAVDEAR